MTCFKKIYKFFDKLFYDICDFIELNENNNENKNEKRKNYFYKNNSEIENSEIENNIVIEIKKCLSEIDTGNSDYSFEQNQNHFDFEII